MTNEQALELLSARIDGPLTPSDQQALQVWLAENPDNQVLAEAFQTQHGELQTTFEPRREAARATAAAVARQLVAVPAAAAIAPAKSWWRSLTSPLPAACAAAVVIAIGILAFRRDRTPDDRQGPSVASHAVDPFAGIGLTARARPEAPKSVALAVGETIRIGRGEKRRVTLPDGSLLYLNQNTTVQLTSDRHVKLDRGEMFLEAVPAKTDGERFVVETAKRSVTALGTKFAVSASDAGTGVLVTQGKVEVSGLDKKLTAGQELLPAGEKVVPAPRASAALDWTRDLMIAAESPLVPAGKHSGGSLVAVDPYGQEAKLSLVKYHVDVHIEDGFARTTIDQTYFNAENWRMEGTFYFPLPPDASLSRLAMYVDGDLMEGGMADRGHARDVYETIRYQNRDPALLEWVDGSVFKMRVFPLEARQEKRIVLSYQQKLPVLYGQAYYRFPAGHTLAVVDKWSFRAFVKDGANLSTMTPSHPSMKLTPEGLDLVITDQAEDIKVDRDIVLQLQDHRAAAQPETFRWSGGDLDGQKYLLLRYRPELPSAPRRERRDWVFLFESSGARDPLLARAQVEIFRSLLAHAEHDDTFAMLSVGTRVRKWQDNPLPATPENVAAGIRWLEARHLIGALNLDQALSDARPLLQAGANPHLVHVGSGIASIGEQRADELVRRVPEGVRYVGIGVGKRVAPAFMKVAAERSGGLFTQVNPDEPIGWRGFEIASTLNAPRLLNVRVETPGVNAVRFLTFSNTLAHGEEFAAVANVTHGLPRTVVVRGTLDGQDFARTIAIDNVMQGAGYLPRTWAKLEIDRMMAESSQNNEKAITELSKAMYVMTPFTSLLVLESEQMYKDFKVDRGRKDHWAMYPCPAKIPVVHIPDPNYVSWGSVDLKGQKPHENAVLQTVMVRNQPRFLTWPGQGGNNNAVETAGQRYGNVHFLMPVEEGEMNFTNEDMGVDLFTHDGETRINGVMLGMRGRSGATKDRLLSLGGGNSSLNDVRFFVERGESDGREVTITTSRGKRRVRVPVTVTSAISSESKRILRRSGANSLVTETAPVAGKPILSYDFALMMDGATYGLSNQSMNRPVNGRFLRGFEEGFAYSRLMDSSGEMLADSPRQRGMFKASLKLKKLAAEFIADEELSKARSGRRQRGSLPETVRLTEFRKRLVDADKREKVLEDAPDQPNLDGWHYAALARAPQYYGRPSFNGDQRVFYDLASYAPGMSSSLADIRAVLEAEAAPRFGNKRGTVDPAARKLIDAARTAEWKAIRFGDKTAGQQFTYNGRGQYAYERTLIFGLKEQVVCDGEHLWHLYPELGLGAKRAVSRFHRAPLTDLIPDFVLPADDLAYGVDVKALNARTVALVPLATNKEEPPIIWLEVHLVFDGPRLAERQLHLQSEELRKSGVNGLLLREVYEGGAVRLLDHEGKEFDKSDVNIAKAEKPDLKPEMSRLVVLPLPLRSRDVVYRKFGMEPNYNLYQEQNACHVYLDKDSAMELLAAEFGSGNGRNVAEIWHSCFRPVEDERPGFFTLMTSANYSPRNIGNQLAFKFEKDPSDPLVRYLWQIHEQGLHEWQARFGLALNPDANTFLGKLTAFKHVYSRWQGGYINDDVWGQRDGERRRVLEFAVNNADNVLGWSTLALVQDRCPQRGFQEVADAWGVLAEKSAMKYPARYEQARCLGHTGQHKALAQEKYQNLFRDALKEGVLPPLDSSFRDVLESGQQDEWARLMRETATQLKKARPVIVTLAWQCYQLGDIAMSDTLLELSAKDATTEEKAFTSVAAIHFLNSTSRYDRADALVRELLANKDYALSSGLWRLASQVADNRKDSIRAIECLEKALDIEYARLPEMFDVQPIRNDYSRLLSHYEWLADAAESLRVPAPKDITARVVKAADRWRYLDPEASDVPNRTAAILRKIGGDGSAELAWDYATTPLALKPNESSPWVSLAWSLRQEGDWQAADRAYAMAFAAEPTNAQLLWDRAQHLQQQGQTAESRRLLEQVSAGDWQPRFNGLKAQAREAIRGR